MKRFLGNGLFYERGLIYGVRFFGSYQIDYRKRLPFSMDAKRAKTLTGFDHVAKVGRWYLVWGKL